MPLDLALTESKNEGARATLDFAPYEWGSFKSWCLLDNRDACPTDAILRVLTEWIEREHIYSTASDACLKVYECNRDTGGRIEIAFSEGLWEEIKRWAQAADALSPVVQLDIVLLEWIVRECVPILPRLSHLHERQKIG